MKFKSYLIKFICIFCFLLLGTNLTEAYCNNNVSSEVQIKKLFTAQQFFMNNSSMDKLKDLYSDNYVSNDGFRKDELFNLYADTVKNHPDIKYNVKITKISVDGDYATVRALSNTHASTAEKSKITNDRGLLSVDMETIFYLKKNGDDWKIVSENTISEKTSLLYGSCKTAGLSLSAPESVDENAQYTATLRINPNYANYAMGSIKKELITYPSKDAEDIFRAFDNTGEIERIFKSNKTHHNETIAASVALASGYMKSLNNFDLKISGLAILLQRVNIMSVPIQNCPVPEQKAENVKQ